MTTLIYSSDQLLYKDTDISTFIANKHNLSYSFVKHSVIKYLAVTFFATIDELESYILKSINFIILKEKLKNDVLYY